MIFIDLHSNPPTDATWLSKSDKLTKDLEDALDKAARDKIIDSNDAHWGKIKEHLSKLSYTKCWYSESRDVYSYMHIDHFRPKKEALGIDDKTDEGGYWWLTFCWKNYRFCGGVGNTIKRHYFAVKAHKCKCSTDPMDDELHYLLDPTKPSDPKKLTFFPDGDIVPIQNDVNAFDHQRAAYTIDKLDLRFPALKAARRRAWAECSEKIEETKELIKQYNAKASASIQTSIDKNEDWFRQKIAPCNEFSAVYKTCLKSSVEEWAFDLLGEALDIKKWCKKFEVEVVPATAKAATSKKKKKG
jgi:uncharacterized protein (TIGR02646 family)